MSDITETATFSALVDEAILRSGRKDRVRDIISYARTSVRECTVLANFQQSLVELQLTVTANPHNWVRPMDLRSLTAVKYPYFTRRGDPIFADEKLPGTVKPSDKYFFYLSGDTFIFSDVAVGDVLNIAYLSYGKKLAYYALETDRPARFDEIAEAWVYTDAYDDNDTLKQQAQNLVTNWLIFRWYDLIIEGVLAKLFKQVNDDRSKTSFALYKAQQKDLLAGEASIYVRS